MCVFCVFVCVVVFFVSVMVLILFLCLGLWGVRHGPLGRLLPAPLSFFVPFLCGWGTGGEMDGSALGRLAPPLLLLANACANFSASA